VNLAIYFDRQPTGRAVEIYDVRSDRVLLSKSDADSFSPEPLP